MKVASDTMDTRYSTKKAESSACFPNGASTHVLAWICHTIDVTILRVVYEEGCVHASYTSGYCSRLGAYRRPSGRTIW